MPAIQLMTVSRVETNVTVGTADTKSLKLNGIQSTFSDYMQQAPYSYTQSQIKGTGQENVKVNAQVRQEYEQQQSQSAAQADKVRPDTVSDADSGTGAEDAAVEEAVGEAAEQIKETVKENLGVDDEQIDAAMELLGLTQADLLNPPKLAMLAAELTGNEDVGMMLFAEDFQVVLQESTAITEGLLKDLGMTRDELMAKLQTLVQPDESQAGQGMEPGQAVHPEQTEQSGQTARFDQIVQPEEPNSSGQIVQSVQTGQNVQQVTEETVQNFAQSPETDTAATAVPEETSAANGLEADASQEEAPQAPQGTAEPAGKQAVTDSDAHEVAGAAETVDAVKADTAKAETGQTDAETLDQEGQQPSAMKKVQGSQDREQSFADGRDESFENRSDGETRHANVRENPHFEFHVNMRPQQSMNAPAATHAPVQTPMPQIDVQDVIQQIVEHTRVTLNETVKSIEMQLNPENLGKVYLHVTEKEGHITAQITAQNENLKETLIQQAATLKDNLNQQGIKVEAVEVSVGTHEFESNLERDAHGEEEQARQQAEQSRQNARRGINLSELGELDGLSGLLSEEEELVARIMRDYGNNVDYKA